MRKAAALRFLCGVVIVTSVICVFCRGCYDDSEIRNADNNARSSDALAKTYKSQLDAVNKQIIESKVDANEMKRGKDEEISKLANENNSLRESISSLQAAHVVQLSSNFDTSLTNVLNSALSGIVPSKPSFQLILNSFVDKQVADRISTNLLTGPTNIIHITHNLEIARTANVRGISPGEIIDLKKSKDISLSVIVYGDSPADHLTIQLATPWVDQANITGDMGWQDFGESELLDSSTKTYSHAHSMVLERIRLLPPNECIPLPPLHIPTNYPSADLPIRFKISSSNSKSQEVGVLFRLE